MTKECELGEFGSVAEIKRANERAEKFWFSPNTLRFFRGTVSKRLHGGCLFVSSEQRDDHSPRGYTIRVAMADGDIETVSGLMYFKNKPHAENAAACIAALLPKYPGQCPSEYDRTGELAEKISEILSGYPHY